MEQMDRYCPKIFGSCRDDCVNFRTPQVETENGYCEHFKVRFFHKGLTKAIEEEKSDVIGGCVEKDRRYTGMGTNRKRGPGGER